MERSWYYMQDNQQMGPVGQSQLVQLMQEGVVRAETFVWSEGMEDWKPAGQVDLGAQIPQLRPVRPTAVTVFGILNIVFGGLGLMCAPLAIVALMLPMPQQGAAVAQPPAMQVFSLFSYGVGIIVAAVLLAAGIGLLKQRRWARQVTYYYGWFAIVWGVISLAVTVAINGAAAAGASGPEATEAVGAMVGGICGGILGLVYPIFAVIYMKKPHVVAACSA